LQIFCQNASCRRLYNIPSTIVWVQSGAKDFQKRLGTRIREIRTAKGIDVERLLDLLDEKFLYLSRFDKADLLKRAEVWRRAEYANPCELFLILAL
jgi:hypothetical protein